MGSWASSGGCCFRSRWSWTYWCRQCSGRVGARADTGSTQADGQTIWSEYYAYEPLCGWCCESNCGRRCPGRDDWSRKSGKIYGNVEGSRSESNSCCCFCGSCETYGAGRSRCNCCRRLRVWRTCRREHDYDTCTTGRWCSRYSGYCRRWNRRRKRNCSSIYAGSKGCTDGNCICCHRRGTGAPELQG